VASQVLAIIAEKTGYPPEMLDLDLDLEADLGVDTVKQAETFAAVREAFSIPRIEDLQLRDYPTLNHVIGFVREQRPDLAAAPAPVVAPVAPTPVAPAPAVAAPVAPAADPVASQVLAIIAEKTGYPPEMLDLDLDLEADLGVDTVKQAETFAAVREAFSIPRIEDLQLRDYPTLNHVIGFVRTQRPDLAAAAAAAVAPAPTATPVPVDSAVPAEDPVTAQVLAIIAEKTGYPPEMLDLDLDLEADLGVDTVKQAETFAAVREAFSIPTDRGSAVAGLPDVEPRDRLRLRPQARAQAGRRADWGRSRCGHRGGCAERRVHGDARLDGGRCDDPASGSGAFLAAPARALQVHWRRARLGQACGGDA
jgi:acyl carrier protein